MDKYIVFSKNSSDEWDDGSSGQWNSIDLVKKKIIKTSFPVIGMMPSNCTHAVELIKFLVECLHTVPTEQFFALSFDPLMFP